MNKTYRTYITHKTYSYLTRRRALIVISVLLAALLVSAPRLQGWAANLSLPEASSRP